MAAYLALFALVVAGCGSTVTAGTGAPAGATDTATVGATGGDRQAAASSGDHHQAAAIDVCALLTPAAAQAIATAHKVFDPKLTYTVETRKQNLGAQRSDCSFTGSYNDQFGDREYLQLSVVTLVPTNGSLSFQSCQQVVGSGDVAYQCEFYDAVVSSGYVLSADKTDGYDDAFYIDFLRAMTPALKTQLGSS